MIMYKKLFTFYFEIDLIEFTELNFGWMLKRLLTRGHHSFWHSIIIITTVAPLKSVKLLFKRRNVLFNTSLN